MTDSKKKNFVGVILFAIIQAMFLFHHFSIAAVINTCFILLYLVIKNIVKNNDESRDISYYLGQYIGVSFLNIMIIQFTRLIDAKFIENFETFAEEERFGMLLGVAIGAPVALLFYFIGGSIIPKKGPIIRLVKYASLYGLSVLLLSSLYDYEKVGNIYFIAPAIFFVMFYLVDILINRIYTADNKPLFISALFSSAVFIMSCCISPKYGNNILTNFTYLGLQNEWKWYNIALISVVFLTASVVCFVIDNNSNYDNNTKNSDELNVNDTINLMLIGFDIVSYTLAIRFYNKHIAIFAFLLLVVNVLIIVVPFNRSKKEYTLEKIFSDKFITALCLFFALALLFVGYINGIIDIIVISLLAAIVGLAMFESKWASNIFIILIGILSADIAYHWHNSKSIFMFIIATIVIASLVMLVLGIVNKRTEVQQHYVYQQALVFICASIVILTCMVHTGINIDYRVDRNITNVDSNVSETVEETNNIIVTLKPHGKDNSVSYCSYYWQSEKDNIIIPEIQDGTFIVNKKGSDTLVVVCTDKDGVITTSKHLFNIK